MTSKIKQHEKPETHNFFFFYLLASDGHAVSVMFESFTMEEIEDRHGQRLFSKPICAKERNGPPSTDQRFLKLNPEAAMLFAPFRCTHPPPPIPTFLLA